MQDLPHDMYALFALACALGVKHGLDPDHLATINGLIRFNSPTKPWLAKWSGVLFSLGHGLVVTIVIGMVAAMPEHMAIPGWLQQVGAVFSILILLLLGVLNLYAAGNSHQAITRAVSLKRWMCFKSGHPAAQ